MYTLISLLPENVSHILLLPVVWVIKLYYLFVQYPELLLKHKFEAFRRIGFKATNPDYTCRCKRYDIGVQSEEPSARLCMRGMHYSLYPWETLLFYKPASSRLLLVVAQGDIDGRVSTISTTLLTPIKELPGWLRGNYDLFKEAVKSRKALVARAKSILNPNENRKISDLEYIVESFEDLLTCDDSTCVVGSKDVMGSSDVRRSRRILQSAKVGTSVNITMSRAIEFSAAVIYSHSVRNSKMVLFSNYIEYSKNVFGCCGLGLVENFLYNKKVNSSTFIKYIEEFRGIIDPVTKCIEMSELESLNLKFGIKAIPQMVFSMWRTMGLAPTPGYLQFNDDLIKALDVLLEETIF